MVYGTLVQSSIDDKGENLYTRVLDAARRREDQVMLNRLLGVVNGDLVAAEARYHRDKSCVTNYTNERNIAALSPADSNTNIIIQQVIHEFKKAIIEDQQVIPFTKLRHRYIQLEGSTMTKGLARNIKRLLQTAWPEVAFIAQPGRSDVVCSGTVSVGDAVKKAYLLNQTLADVEADNLEDLRNLEVTDTEEAILHSAAHRPTPTSHSLSGAPPLPSHGKGAGHTPTPTSHCLSQGRRPCPHTGKGRDTRQHPRVTVSLRGAALALTRERGGTHANTHESLSLSGAPPLPARPRTQVHPSAHRLTPLFFRVLLHAVPNTPVDSTHCVGALHNTVSLARVTHSLSRPTQHKSVSRKGAALGAVTPPHSRHH
ncbi:hypothetical protein GWK47_051889 [Chionoecetes opilio]|uniref:Uncharacterized protein n=1 Tax=Chionoecetes opilio TaxID=41210 RepID=A0A8J4Y0I5_CHIOP|nr:hypothetical protein GWK47_051889 [Chionoecetes opilio]